jgi:hypothetical protein
MLMFNEFCRALELIEKSGKNGSKQHCLDSLWQKVLQSTLLFKQHCSFFSRTVAHHLPAISCCECCCHHRTTNARRERASDCRAQQLLIAFRYNMRQPTMAKLFLDVLQVKWSITCIVMFCNQQIYFLS